MEYLVAGGPVMNSPNVNKGIITLAINIYTYTYTYIYNNEIFIMKKDVHNEKKNHIFENIFRLMSLSIHSLFTIKTATK